MNDNRLFVRARRSGRRGPGRTASLSGRPHDGTPAVDDAPAVDAPVLLAVLGAHLYESKGCIACHTIDGTPRIGPSFLHDYGTQIALADGRTVEMNDDYVRESMVHPQAAARPGYPRGMPTYGAAISEHELRALTAYVASLR